jgi:hypothetical protein
LKGTIRRHGTGVKTVRAENLDELIRAVPFRPFTICLANGARVDIPHPEWIFHPPGTRTAVVMSPDESVRIIDVGLVLELQLGPPLPAGTIAAGNPDGGD